MKQSDDNKKIRMVSIKGGQVREITQDVAYYTNKIVNLVMIGGRHGEWVKDRKCSIV